MTKFILTQQYLDEAITYNALTGIVKWKERPCHHFKNLHGMRTFNARFAGKEAGTELFGYRSIILNKTQFMLHNVIWVLVNGKMPEGQIDHQNRDRSDNRFVNLRDVPISINLKNKGLYKNNKSGQSGVYWSNSFSKWIADISTGDCRKILGKYDKKEDAVKARKEAEFKCGYHVNHGSITQRKYSHG